MKTHSISPYPPEVTIKGEQVFVSGKYAGHVDRVQNWGTDFLARPLSERNKFFATKTDAVLYIANEQAAAALAKATRGATP